MKNDFSYLCLKHRSPAYGGSANTPVPGIALYTQGLLLCLPLPFASVETKLDYYLVGKELVILLFVCVVLCFYVFSFPPGVYVGTLDLIASIPGPSILTLLQKGTSRQRSGKDAIRKRFPLQKPRWEKTKLTIRYLYHENTS